MFRPTSWSSSRSAWWEARNSTAWSWRATPSSRWASTESHTASASAVSSAHVRNSGRRVPATFDHSSMREALPGAASAITALATVRMGVVER